MVSREVFQEDALEWLGKRAPLPSSSLVASLPDYSEFPKLSLAEWKIWFEEAACAIMRSCPERGVVIFYQRDIKHDGVWVDKAFLCQKAAEKEGMHQLWHKIVQRAPAGQVTFGKPGYSHLICFSRGLHLEPGQSSADVLVDAGESTWVRGMGTRVCEMICGFLLKCTETKILVAPFCGEGALLAVANKMGLSAIGIERSRKRAEKARLLMWEQL